MTDAKDKKIGVLCRTAQTVVRMFRNGHHPTENQLLRLEGAIANFEMMKLCGHKLIDDCDCLDIQEAKQ